MLKILQEFVTKFLFAAIFMLIVTPAGMVLRLLQIDFLKIKPDVREYSYWTKKIHEKKIS
jgi:hypothetical protein